MLWWRRERKGEACLLTLRLLELNIRTPGRGFTRGRGFARSRGGLRSATGKKMDDSFSHTSSWERRVMRRRFSQITFKSHKPHAWTRNISFYLSVRVIASDESRARRLTATKLHGTSPRGEQSSTEAVAEVQTDNRKGSRWVRNRNNEGQCDRFVKAEKSEEWMARSPVWPDDVIASETASRHQPMNWRDSIWVQDSVTRRRSQSGKLRSVELPMKENFSSLVNSGFINASYCIRKWSE